MRNKDSRLEAIKLLVSSQEISSQGELLRELRRVGFTPTQATLSRDLHRLKVAKAMSHTGKYVYMLPGSPLYRRVSDSALTFAAARQAGVLSVKFSGNLAVVKTRPGYAMGIASDIDSHAPNEILATIAGDDTILVIPRNGVSQAQVIAALARFV